MEGLDATFEMCDAAAAAFESVLDEGVVSFEELPADLGADAIDAVGEFFPMPELNSFDDSTEGAKEVDVDGNSVSAEEDGSADASGTPRTAEASEGASATGAGFEDLRGSTAMASRRMTPEERLVVLHKRKLRNRQSAKRSRARRLKTIAELSEVFEEISRDSEALKRKAEIVVEQNKLLKEENSRLQETLELYRKALDQKKSESGGIVAAAA
mmetsp:Transcript_13709/g.36812  ORF Transcript_13709/g.36812 Transcript_13709/m.36812 type:complete len:213 (+) Transcript_13709:55-693(+)